MRDLPSVLAWARSTAWAIDPRYGRTAYTALLRRALGTRLSADEIAEALAAPRANVEAHEVHAAAAAQKTGGSVAVIPIIGMIRHRGGLMADESGSQSAGLQGLSKALRSADADPSIRAIVLDVDSPGGSVEGMTEASAMLRGLQTPVIGVANTLAASAAYWLLAQADLVYATPSAMVGSVGVYSMHVDESEYLAHEGIAVSLVSAGEFKVEGNPFGPLEAEARNRMQAVVDAAYDDFVREVATGRGVATKAVLEKYGRGRVLTAREALSAGMVDRIGTLDDAIERAARGRLSKRRAKAAASGDPPIASCGMDEAMRAAFTAAGVDLTAGVDAAAITSDDPTKQADTIPDDTAAELLELEFMALGSRD